MYFPPEGFCLDDARRCAAVVEIARNMYSQWKQQGNPAQDQFQWEPEADFKWISDTNARTSLKVQLINKEGSNYYKPIPVTSLCYYFLNITIL